MNSKGKGSNYERKIGKLLTSAYYPDKDGIFERIYAYPMPAAGETRSDLKAMKYISVDGGEKQLVKDSSWPFVIECKFYREIAPLFSGLYRPKGDCQIYEWYFKTLKIADDEKKMLMIVFRLNQTKDMCILGRTDFSRLEDIFGAYSAKAYDITKRQDRISMVIVRFDDLLEWIDFTFFRVKNYGNRLHSLVMKSED